MHRMMKGSTSNLHKEFLKNWLKGLKKYTYLKKNMNIKERKKAIKLSADLAMASTRKQTTLWSKALIANASQDDDRRILAEHMLGQPECERLRKAFISSMVSKNKRRYTNYCSRRKKMILRRNYGSGAVRRVKNKVMASSNIAKRLVKKRTMLLKSLVPGGEFMDHMCLIEETLDYIQSLRAQVHGMRCLVGASNLITSK